MDVMFYSGVWRFLCIWGSLTFRCCQFKCIGEYKKRIYQKNGKRSSPKINWELRQIEKSTEIVIWLHLVTLKDPKFLSDLTHDTLCKLYCTVAQGLEGFDNFLE